MMRSLYSGVAGLRTHQTKMDVIGNNIANVNTTAFKSQSVTFRDLMYQTTQSASGANAETGVGGINARQIGLGVTTGAINTNISGQGSAQTTNNPFDIMITGDNFFVVNNGLENFYTRDGSFYVDGVGNLAMTSTGYNVMGWKVNGATGLPDTDDNVTPLQVMNDENMTYSQAATTDARVTGIIDKNDSKVNSVSGRAVNLLIYDDAGYEYTVKFSVHSTTENGQYYVELEDILDSEGVSIGATSLAQVTFGEQLDVAVSKAYTLVNGTATGSGTYTITDGTGSFAGTVGGTATTPADAAQLAALQAAYPSADFTKITGFSLDGNGVLTVTAASDASLVGKTYNVKTGTFSTDTVVMNDGATTLTVTPPDTDLDVTTLDDATKQAILALYGLDVDAEGVNTLQVSADGTLTITNQTVQNSAYLVYSTADGSFTSAGGNGTGKLQLGFGAGLENFLPISLDFSVTQNVNNNGSSTISAARGTSTGLGAGRKLGKMISLSVQKDGVITASYDNGMSKCLGQIATAVFANPSGLEKQGDNLYSATMNSGDAMGVDVTANGGYMQSGVLEMSNVDLSAEFTEMITTQRGFQANSRIITVSDTMLEELTNLKR